MAAFTVHSRRETLIFEQEEREVRVYLPDGLSTEIIVPEDYAQKLDCDEYSGRATPADVISSLVQLPNSAVIERIYLLDQAVSSSLMPRSREV